MAENEIEFSRKIIPALLRNIVDSNMLKLTVGEIEGDAVVFYRFGALPSLKELVDQSKFFYLNFNKELKLLMENFADDFHKNASSDRLSLKVIVHAAEMTSTLIGGIPKLIGRDVVIVHKLLKNSIKETEYILLTEKLLANYPEKDIAGIFDWDSLKQGKDEYDYIGSINYNYIVLNPLIELSQDNIAKSQS